MNPSPEAERALSEARQARTANEGMLPAAAALSRRLREAITNSTLSEICDPLRSELFSQAVADVFAAGDRRTYALVPHPVRRRDD